ncbi:MAG: exonuclease domain-containing protein [Thalassotalea sp.]
MDLLHRRIPNKFIILCIATTGLDVDFDEVIEVGAIKVECTSHFFEIKYFDELLDSINDIATSPEIIETSHFHAIVESGVDIQDDVTAINGFTNDIIDDEGQDSLIVIDKLTNFIDGLPVITYSKFFTKPFLDLFYEYNGKTAPEEIYCIQSQLRRAIIRLPSYKLEDVIIHFNIALSRKFKSLDDARLVLKLLNKIL